MGFSKIAELYRVLAADDCTPFERIEKDSVGGIHSAKVPGTDRAHLNDFSVDELHSVSWCEDARIGHSVIVIHGETFSGSFHPHTFVPLACIILRSLFPAPFADITASQLTNTRPVEITPLEHAGR